MESLGPEKEPGLYHYSVKKPQLICFGLIFCFIKRQAKENTKKGYYKYSQCGVIIKDPHSDVCEFSLTQDYRGPPDAIFKIQGLGRGPFK